MRYFLSLFALSATLLFAQNQDAATKAPEEKDFKHQQEATDANSNDLQSRRDILKTYKPMTMDDPVLEIRPLSAETLNRKLTGELAGKGQSIIEAAKKYGIDPLFFASVIATETAWGKSKILKFQNNPVLVPEPHINKSKGNLFAGKYKKFKSVDEGIDAGAAYIKAITQAKHVTAPYSFKAVSALLYRDVSNPNKSGSAALNMEDTLLRVINSIAIDEISK